MATTPNARVLTFHVEATRMTDVVDAIDDAIERAAGSPGFVGMLGLVDDGHRPQVLMISLWDAQDPQTNARDAEEERRRLAEAVDTGVTSRTLSVLRFAVSPSRQGDTDALTR
jgi:hypothetical protein